MLFDPIYYDYDIDVDFNDTYFSRLRNMERNPDHRIVELIQRPEVIASFEKYFTEVVSPKLNPHIGMDLCTAILTELEENRTINDNTKKSYMNLYYNNEIGPFLAHTFMYSLSVPNKSTTELVKTEIPSDITDIIAAISNQMDAQTETILNAIRYTNSDVSLYLNDNYSISYAAKRPGDAFRMLIYVTKSSFPEDCSDFNSLLGYVLFSGKPVELQVQRIQVTTPEGRVLEDTYNRLIDAETVLLPELRTLCYDKSAFPACPSSIIISSTCNTKELELRNSQGDTLFPQSLYRIERERIGNRIRTSFILEDDDYMDLRFLLEVPQKPRKNMRVKSSMSLTMKNNSSVICNIRYYDLLLKMGKTDKLSLFSCENQDMIPFLSFNDFARNNELIVSDAEGLLSLFHKLYKIEDYFGGRFDISDFSQSNVYYAQVLYQLSTTGKVSLGKQTLKMNYFPEKEDTIREYSLNQTPAKYDSSFDGVKLFDQYIDLSDKYHIRWYSHEIDILEDHIAKVHSIKTILYDPEMYDDADLDGEVDSVNT